MSASPEDVLRGHAPEIVALAQRLRALVRETVPEAEERAALGWGAITFRTPSAGYFAGVFPRKEHVMLLFEHGVALPDADGVLTERRAQTAWAKLRPGDKIPEKALVRLLLLASR